MSYNNFSNADRVVINRWGLCRKPGTSGLAYRDYYRCSIQRIDDQNFPRLLHQCQDPVGIFIRITHPPSFNIKSSYFNVNVHFTPEEEDIVDYREPHRDTPINCIRTRKIAESGCIYMRFSERIRTWRADNSAKVYYGSFIIECFKAFAEGHLLELDISYYMIREGELSHWNDPIWINSLLTTQWTFMDTATSIIDKINASHHD